MPKQNEAEMVPASSDAKVENPRLKIITTGDVFFERYLWSRSHRETTKLPYVWPEELRSARSSVTRREYGGAILHSKIIRHYLNRKPSRDQKTPLYNEENVCCLPSEIEYRALCSNNPYPPLATMLHELKPVSESVDGMATAWRIERCFGVVTPAVPFDDLDDDTAENRKWNIFPLKQIEDDCKADELYWTAIRSLISLISNTGKPEVSEPTVVVINDRDIAELSTNEYSSRTWMKHFFEFLGSCKSQQDNQKDKASSTIPNPDWELSEIGILNKIRVQIKSREAKIHADSLKCSEFLPVGASKLTPEFGKEPREVSEEAKRQVQLICEQEISQLNQLMAAAKDRIRKIVEDFIKIENSFATHENLLILWHTRHFTVQEDPSGDSDASRKGCDSHYRNAIYEFLVRAGLVNSTIMLVNHMCLREAGVELRFDQSYESSIRNILGSLGNPDVKRLLCFPQILIRYDYGVMHLTCKNGSLTGLDIHGLLSGPYRFEPSRYGMVTGTMPLFSAAIIDELHHFIQTPGKTIRQFLDECSVVTDPSILHSTQLDRD